MTLVQAALWKAAWIKAMAAKMGEYF